MTSANTILKRLEDHCGATVDNRRLRNQIICTLEREIEKREVLESRVRAVLDGADTFNPKTHKTIRL